MLGYALATIKEIRVSLDLLHPTVQRAVIEHDLDVEVFPCTHELADTVKFCEHYANCIILSSRRPKGHFAACLVLATHKLDVNKTAKSLMGASRASFASAEATIELTAQEIGGVTPFGLPTDLPIYVDAEIMNRSRIIVGGGNRTTKILCSPETLLRCPQVVVQPSLAIPRDSEAG